MSDLICRFPPCSNLNNPRYVCCSCDFQDDKEAHDLFIKINRAYEVLKDEDLRKKYDQHGEEGLKEDGPHGRRYESWQFYQQNFGGCRLKSRAGSFHWENFPEIENSSWSEKFFIV